MYLSYFFITYEKENYSNFSTCKRGDTVIQGGGGTIFGPSSILLLIRLLLQLREALGLSCASIDEFSETKGAAGSNPTSGKFLLKCMESFKDWCDE